jgi:hypothetical protein
MSVLSRDESWQRRRNTFVLCWQQAEGRRRKQNTIKEPAASRATNDVEVARAILIFFEAAEAAATVLSLVALQLRWFLIPTTVSVFLLRFAVDCAALKNNVAHRYFLRAGRAVTLQSVWLNLSTTACSQKRPQR